MSQPTVDALPLILLAWAAGLAMGWGLYRWAARRQPVRTAAPAAAETPAPPVVVRARSSAVGTRLASDDTARPRPAAPPGPPKAADLLLVDDSAVARSKLRRLFEAAGYQVHLAGDGVEALALLDQGSYQLLITDLEMPNMDGITLINTCMGRPQTARMPILAISGHESLRAKFNACRDIAGIHRKPWVDDLLLSHVVTLVGARQPRTAAGVPPGAGQPA